MKECEEQFMSNLITSYQAQAITWELTRRKADAFGRVVDTLADVPVDLNPHQIDAAVFALNSPFSKGVILADEVGLGKTIEAGIVLAQRFAEGKNRSLVVCSGNMLVYWRKQMIEHFRLPCRILDEMSEDAFSSLDFDGASIISYPLCTKHAEKIAKAPWNLVVFDDAQMLKNT